jgi:hypothetical protein
LSTYDINFVPSNNAKTYNFKRANYVLLYQELLATDWSFLNYYQRFKEYRRLIKRQIASARVAYLSSIQNNIRDDPRKFWSYINSKKGISRIPGRVTCNGDVFDAPQNIVDAFASFFQSVFIASDPDPLISGVNVVSDSSLNIIQISEADISAAIVLIKNSFTAGHDQIPALLVKDCKTMFIQPLLTIFNASLRQSKFPSLWKISKIIPVFKNGDRSIIDNYRSISILSHFSKIFEIVLYFIYSAFFLTVAIGQGSPNYGPRANTGPRAPPIRPAVAGRTYPVSGPHCKIYCQKRKKTHQPIYATDQSLSDDDFKYFFLFDTVRIREFSPV